MLRCKGATVLGCKGAAPIFQLVTDHTRFGPPGSSSALDALVEAVTAGAAAGVELVHVREPLLSDEMLFHLVQRIVARAGQRCRILVNERFDIALAASAAGVHLRASSMLASRIRPHVPPGFLIGRSVHTVAEIEDACRDGAVDYLVLGTIFSSASKSSGHPAIGPAALADGVKASAVPLLAIGGITADHVSLVAKAGAAGMSAIGWLTDAARRGTIAAELSAARQVPSSGRRPTVKLALDR